MAIVDRGFTAPRRTPAGDPPEREQWVQLATRIPRALHRALKVHCVHADTTLSRFVVVALTDKLRRAGAPFDATPRSR